jgi:hypothetical protein
MSVKRAFFSVFQKFMVICCTVFFGFSNAFSANLPSGYTELEYIESTGTQYIDTGLAVKSNTLADFDYQYTNCDSTNYVFGQVSGTATSIMGYRTTRIWWFKPTNLSNACDLNKHTVSFASDGKVYQDGQVLATMGSFSGTQSATMKLFAELNDENVINKGRVKIYNFTFKEGSTIVRNFVPAKNSSGVIGMYDTVNNVFYTNKGTGTFTAGPVALNPCRNLFNPNGCTDGKYYTEGLVYTDHSNLSLSNFIDVTPGKTYTISGYAGSALNLRVNFFDRSQTVKSQRVFSSVSGNYVATFEVPANIYYIRYSFFTAWKNTQQVEEGSTATAYVPFCANIIKIATTAYNTAQFSPVMTDLNSTIATIRDVVTNTINQTKAIADLQAKKQTRPDEQCPAGKKCLLVEDNDGVPHWYEIIEAPED